MPRIIIDTEVHEALASRAHPWRDTPNDVLRALLGLPPAADRASAEAAPLPGQLGPLIRAGLLRPGERITWHRCNIGEIYSFTVTADGFLTDDEGTVLSPNRAAHRIAGHPVRAWQVFRTASGTTLAELAESLAATGQPSSATPAPSTPQESDERRS